jgi:fructose-1,6-bisphosphatase/sedoheptulose 1,7-bisphosphatase-like protein
MAPTATNNAKTVKISAAAHEALRDAAARRGTTMQELVEHLVAMERDQLMLEEMENAFAAVAADPDLAQAQRDERELWDATLADGL